jgi:hypothetical protein
MSTSIAATIGLAFVFACVEPAEAKRGRPHEPHIRRFGTTIVEGASDGALWERVLDLLPSRPERIVIIDLDALEPGARERFKALEAFVLTGIAAVIVVRQGPTLQQAEHGSAVDTLALASIVWHEMAHLDGLDEAAAVAREQELWHRWHAFGRVDAELALTYVNRLQLTLDRGRGRKP